MMKKNLYGLALCLMMGNVSSVQACGSLSAFFATPPGEAVFTYVTINGQQFFGGLVTATIDSLTLLQTEDPTVFNAYVNYCLNGIQNSAQGPFTDDVMALLKQFNLIQADATVSDVILTIVSTAIQQLDNGNVQILSLDDLIQASVVTVS